MSEAAKKQITVDQVVAAYLATRDEISAEKKKFEEWEKERKLLQARREEWIQNELHRLGAESFKTKFGIAFKTYKTGATVKDWDTFFNYVLENEAWDLLEHRCAKKAVEAHMGTELELPPPPGVDYTRIEAIQIRRK